MSQRGLEKVFVEATLANGEVIEEYESSEEARYLMHWEMELGEASFSRHLHVVAADQAHGRTLVITAYDPQRSQPDRWSDDFKTRLD